MRAIVLAYHDIGTVCLEELLAQGDEVAALFTHEDNPREEVWWRSTRGLAERHGIPTFTPEDINTAEWAGRIRALAPDILFSFYYRHMVRPEILEIPPLGALNLHGGLLPRYRGRAPINWVLVNGETETGVTLHYMVAKPDAGDIVAQRRVPILFEDTARTLFGRMTDAARGLMHDTLPLLREGRAPRAPQDLSQGSYFGGRRPEDGRIAWEWPATRIYNLVRAVTHPYPGAFTTVEGRKLLVWWARPLPGTASGTPGEVLSVDPASGTAQAQTGEGVLQVERIQLEGEAERDAGSLSVGMRLGG